MILLRKSAQPSIRTLSVHITCNCTKFPLRAKRNIFHKLLRNEICNSLLKVTLRYITGCMRIRAWTTSAAVSSQRRVRRINPLQDWFLSIRALRIFRITFVTDFSSTRWLIGGGAVQRWLFVNRTRSLRSIFIFTLNCGLGNSKGGRQNSKYNEPV